MRAIVTGSNGFIGFNICRALYDLQWTVLGIDDLSNGLLENTVPGFEYLYVPIQDRPAIQRILAGFEPDVVFHLAALPRVRFSHDNPSLTTEVNVLGTVSLLEGITKAGLSGKTRFINSSSSAVYGGAHVRPTPENYPCHPRSAYALQKYHSEQWVRLFVELFDIDGLSLRYFNVFGPHSRFGGAYSTVLDAWLYHLYVSPEYQPFIEGDGTQSRDFCYVDNVVMANILAAKRPRRFQGEVFNIGHGQAHTLLECKEALERVSGRKLPLQHRPPRMGDVSHTLADISLSRKELGYEPSIDFEGQLASMTKWYRDSYPDQAKKRVQDLGRSI